MPQKHENSEKGGQNRQDIQLRQLLQSKQRTEILIWQILWSIIVLGVAGLLLAIIGLIIKWL